MLLQIDGIQEALVYAKHADAGRYLAADIRLQQEYARTDVCVWLDKIRTELNEKLPSYMRLSELHIREEEFEKNRLGKIQRFHYVDQNGQKKRTAMRIA